MGHVDYMAAVAGLPPEHVYEIEESEETDPRRRLAFPFARKLTREPGSIERADVDALKAAFTDDEIVQLVFAICHFNTMNRLAEAFGVPLERTNVFAAPPRKAAKPPEEPEGEETAPAK